jgi:two-component system catabolic regulation response regulator CreB
MPHILIVEDETTIADSLVFVLQGENFSTFHTPFATEALRYVGEHVVDLVIMDVGLPDMTGFEACKRLRSTSAIPVLFLTARGDEIDRIIGLEIGGDDYVTKPFSAREVAARVKAILKRTTQTIIDTPVSEAEFQQDDAGKSIRFRGQPLSLTRLEYHLLKALVDAPGQVLARETLMEVLGITRDAGYERNIDSHVKSLRAKLRQIAPTSDVIQTQRGFGYYYRPGH